jgi:hypothetical protein
MAMVPAGDRPPELADDFPWPTLRAASEEDEDEVVLELREAGLLVKTGTVGVLTTVTTSVEAG